MLRNEQETQQLPFIIPRGSILYGYKCAELSWNGQRSHTTARVEPVLFSPSQALKFTHIYKCSLFHQPAPTRARKSTSRDEMIIQSLCNPSWEFTLLKQALRGPQTMHRVLVTRVPVLNGQVSHQLISLRLLSSCQTVPILNHHQPCLDSDQPRGGERFLLHHQPDTIHSPGRRTFDPIFTDL